METSTNKIPTILIAGAGIGGLSFYHSVRKNLGKKFNVKIFDRETSPQDRWQGHNIYINKRGVNSLFYCTPAEVQDRFPEAMPDPIPKEYHTIMLVDHIGRQLFYFPQHKTKSLYEIESLKHDYAGIISYRNKLRDVLLEGVDIQWGKKCVGYEECDNGVWILFEDGTREFGDLLIGADGVNSPIRKQKIPNLEINDLGLTSIDVDVAIPKNLADRLMNVYSNVLIQQSLGINGDSFFSYLRLIPIDQFEEPSYRLTIGYSYPTNLDIKEKISIDDNDPESVMKHAISRIKQLRPPCELTDLFIELLSLVPFSHPGEKYPYRAYNPPRRRQFRDIDPLSVPPWKNDRIVLLGDAVHAMNPLLGLGANNAIQDADLLTKELLNYENDGLTKCIQRYNEQMRVRSSRDVIASRKTALRNKVPLGNMDLIVRNSMFRVTFVVFYIIIFIKTLFLRMYKSYF
ncbi:FAD/NADP-binding domain-containing protein [Gigaspora margarita]|uniref:FAD/NADP-binding domain-containing protein n=1 Tax=Gigaspora margarita TaxID=4874 RepID=A0A8H4ATD0_GIGMA|nr:FAD/NADP-binding domain-containing protein [Gigaspora margarita]